MNWEIFFLLLLAHAVTDFGLQSPWIAKAKNRHSGPPSSYDPKIHGPVRPIWFIVMAAHAGMNAAGVYVVTGSIFLAILEFVVHYLIDSAKAEGAYNLYVDQSFHVASKFFYVASGVV